MPRCQHARRYRKSVRLKGYDYTEPNAYFVTVCTHYKRCIFGEVVHHEMALNAYGHVAHECWQGIPNHFPVVELDAFQAMPNHVHGIIAITSRPGGADSLPPTEAARPGECARPVQGTRCTARARPCGPARKSLGAIVGSFKSAVTKRINQLRRAPGTHVWQTNYHEHIIRNEREFTRIRDYIINNPASWELDRENPHRTGTSELEEEIFNPHRPHRPTGKQTDQPNA